MTSFSSRYALPIAIAALVALVPAVHTRVIGRQDECGSHAALLDVQALAPGLVVLEEGSRRTSIERGRLTGRLDPDEPDQAPLHLTVARSWGLPNGMLQPAAMLPGRREPDVVERALLETPDGPLPIRYGYERQGSGVRVTAYFIAHRGHAIDSPLFARVADATEALVHGTSPLTLFAISTQTRDVDLAQGKARLDAWLLHAWDHYREVCGASAREPSSETSERRPL